MPFSQGPRMKRIAQQETITTVGGRGCRVRVYARLNRGRLVTFEFKYQGRRRTVATSLEWPHSREHQGAVLTKASVRATTMADAIKRMASEAAILGIAAGAATDSENAAADRDPSGLVLHGRDTTGATSRKSVTVSEAFEGAIGPSLRHLTLTQRRDRTHPYGGLRPSPIGKYASWTQNARAMRRHADEIERIWGSDSTWSELRPTHYYRLWREVKGDTTGAAKERLACALLVAQWVADHYDMPLLRRPAQAKVMLGKEVKTNASSTPKFSQQEWGRYIAVVRDPSSKIDPRIRLLSEFAMEHRLGQASQSWRSDLYTGMMPVLCVQGEGKKHGIPILADRDMALAWEKARGTWLAKQEAEWEMNGIDYPLIPGDLADPVRSIDARHLAKLVATVTERANVYNRPGWYPIRRAATDFCRGALSDCSHDGDVEITDIGVLDAITGHTSKGTRASVYAEQVLNLTPRQLAERGDDDIVWSILRSARAVRSRARENALRAAKVESPFDSDGRERTDIPHEHAELP